MIILLICYSNHSEHFVLNHFEIVSLCCSAESSVWLLTVCVWNFSKIIGMRKIGIRFTVLVAFVRKTDIATTTKYWTIVWITVNCILFVNQIHFLHQIQRKYERTTRSISCIITTLLIPFDGSESAHDFPELSADESECAFDVIALLVKYFSPEPIFRSSVKQLDWFGVIQWFSDEFDSIFLLLAFIKYLWIYVTFA